MDSLIAEKDDVPGLKRLRTTVTADKEEEKEIKSTLTYEDDI